MPARRGAKIRRAKAAPRDGRVVMRGICTAYECWRVCGNKECLRAKTCAGNTRDCFTALWSVLSEATKVGIRAMVAARAAGHGRQGMTAAVDEARQRWREIEAANVAAGDESRLSNDAANAGGRARAAGCG